jgi:hypothetical protein
VDTAAGFSASGGEAKLEAMRITYTGKTSTTLTGIPASGSGSITHALTTGDSVNPLVTVEDVTSQNAYDIREEYVQDRRLSIAGATLRATALLALLKDPRVSGSFDSSDPNIRAGRSLMITMPEWGLSAEVTMRSVTIRPIPGRQQPLASVQFSTRTMDDLYTQLREIREQLAR